jgi:hypothetical protein
MIPKQEALVGEREIADRITRAKRGRDRAYKTLNAAVAAHGFESPEYLAAEAERVAANAALENLESSGGEFSAVTQARADRAKPTGPFPAKWFGEED